jgi:hypothetical protein
VRERLLLFTTGVLAAVALLAAPAAGAEAVSPPTSPEVAFDGRFVPRRLSTPGLAPARLRIDFRAISTDGSVVPALSELTLGLDGNSEVNLGGLPSCRFGQIYLPENESPEERCRGARIGTGTASIPFQFPEDPPLTVTAPIEMFKSGPGAIAAVLYTPIPTPSMVLVKGKMITSSDHRYGKELRLDFPKIAGGAGRISELQLTLGRRFSTNGEAHSAVSARCPRAGQLHVGATATFADGTVASSVSAHRCAGAT